MTSEERREYCREWRRNNKDKVRKYKRDYYRNSSGSLTNLRWRYNMLEKRYNELLERYNTLKEIIVKDSLDKGISIDTINKMYNF